MILLYDPAIRLNELLSLTIKDLSLSTDNPYIRISGKGNKERIVAINSRILGHSSTETTKIYAKPSLEMLRKAIESVETQEQANEKPLWDECSEEEMANLCGLR